MRNKKRKKYKTKQKNRFLFAVMIGIAVISFWRGVWGLLDLYLFPENQTLSFIASIIFGAVILQATHVLVKELLG